MIKIGFIEDLDEDEIEEVQSHQGVESKAYIFKKKQVYVSPEKEKEILESYQEVVVQDYGDDYHLTPEERQKRNEYYKAFAIVRKQKNTYRRLDEYVSAMRNVLRCLDVVAESNGFYDPEIFKEMWVKGEIRIIGLRIPKYSGRDRKRISWEYLADFIFSDEDPSEILYKEAPEIDSEDELERVTKEFFDPGELERMISPETEEEREERFRMFVTRKDDAFIEPVSREEMKEITKKNPKMALNLKDIKKREKRRRLAQNAFVSDMVYDDMEEISRYDSKMGFRNDDEVPKFKGNINNQAAVDRYVREVNEYYDTHVRELYGGKYYTRKEIQDMQFKKELEDEGWNIRKLYGNDEKLKALKKAQKMDEKKSKILKERLLKLNDRYEKRQNENSALLGRYGKRKKNGKKKKKKG